MAIRTGNLGLAVEYGFDDLRPLWMENFVFDNDSDPWDTSLPLRGTYTDTQPITAQPANNHNGQRSLSFADDFYDHIIINPTVIDVGNIVSEQFYTLSVFNGYFENKDLQNLSVTNSDGFSITGPAVGATWGPLQTRTYQLTITTDGPPTIDSSILFDWTGTADDTVVKLVGARIVMLPYQASAPWIENLEWKTNLLTSNNGKEQRIRVRRSPRQSFKAEYPIPNAAIQQAFNIAYGWINRRWAVGVWSETQYISSIANGSTSITCNTSSYDFRANGLICLWESYLKNDIIEVDSVSADSLVLKRVLSKEYSNAILIPVRLGMVAGGNLARNTNGYTSYLDVEYEITDNAVISSVTPEQYLNYDIYYDETLMGDEDGLTDTFKIRLDQVDYETGVVDYFAPWSNTKRARNVQFFNEGPQECWNFKRWLFRRMGRLRPYWLPTFENNLNVKVTGYVISSISCYPNDYQTLGKARTHIAILLNNGTWLPRIVTGSAMNGEYLNVALDLPIDVESSEIRMISYLGLHRLDTDRVEIEWIGNYVNRCAIRIMEIKP